MINTDMNYAIKDDDILYFFHIPKTAGTTLISILDDQFPSNSILKARAWKELTPREIKKFSKYRLIRGHFGYSIYQVLPKKPIYITMLRESIEYTISSYEMNRRIPELAKRYSVNSKKSLSELITDPNILGLINRQTNWLAIDFNVMSLTKSLDPKILKNFYPEETNIFLRSKISDNKLLKIAKKRIEEFAFFGIVEKFEESLMLLYYTFGWKPDPSKFELKLNQAPQRAKKGDLSKDALAIILNRTKLDRELYQFALNLFEKRFENMVNFLKEAYYNKNLEQLSNTQMLLKLLEEHHKNYTNLTNTKPIEFNFKDQINGTGWYLPEITEGKKLFRWTGPEAGSRINLTLRNDFDHQIEFHISNSMDDEITKSLQLKVNNIPVNIKTIKHDKKQITFEGIIPKTILKGKDLTHLDFQVCKTIPPKSINPKSSDPRKLGLAFEWLKLTPI